MTLVCWNDQYHSLVRNSVEPKLFSTYIYRDIIERVYAYIDQFHKPPKEHLPDLVEDLIKGKSEKANHYRDIVLAVKHIAQGLNAEYVVGQLEKFTRQQKIKLAIVQATDQIQKGDVDRAEEVLESAMQSRLTMFDPGITLLDGVNALVTGQEARTFVTLGIPELDLREYGPAKKEVSLFIAPPKRGKTWWLVHLAKRALMQGWRALYITLEVSEMIIARRMIQSLLSVTKRDAPVRMAQFVVDDLKRLVDIKTDKVKRPSLEDEAVLAKLAKKIGNYRFKDDFLVKAFPTSQLSVSGLKGYLDSVEQVHKFIPDLVILDYADLMHVDTNNYRIEVGALYRQLRGVAVERNLAMATASQVNRIGGTSKLVTEIHVAEDYSKIAIADSVLSYSQSSAERDLNVARIYAAAGRNEQDRFAVLIQQQYDLGQFCLDSRRLDHDYWSIIRQAEGDDDDQRD